jgi:hypothetical protein
VHDFRSPGEPSAVPVALASTWRAIIIWPLDDGAHGCRLGATWGNGTPVPWTQFTPHVGSTDKRGVPRAHLARATSADASTFRLSNVGQPPYLPWTGCAKTLEIGAEYATWHRHRTRGPNAASDAGSAAALSA